MSELTLLTSLLFVLEVVSCQVDIGNIRLLPCQGVGCNGNDPAIGTLQILYATDRDPPRWRPVCNDGANDRGFDIICSMMGYSKGRAVSTYMEQTMSFSKSTDWALTGLDCAVPMSNGAPPNHLLRCKYYPMKSGGTCGQSINMMCSGHKGEPLWESDQSYEGQVELCPPDEAFSFSSFPAKQISFGIVSINHGGVWGSLNEIGDEMVGYNQANSICRQLGFTGAVRDSTRTVSSFRGQYNFTHCQSLRFGETGLQRVWLTVPETSRCDSDVCPCFSCCYERPQDARHCYLTPMVNGQCPKGYCCRENDIVLECIFDVTANPPPISGTREQCEFPEGQNFLSMSSAGCSTQSAGNSLHEPLIVFLVLSVVLAIVVVVIFIVLVVVCYKWRLARAGYNRVNGRDNEHEDPQVDDGDQN